MPNAALRVAKNTLALTAGRVSVLVLAFVLVIYAARFLGLEDFGKYSLARGYFDLLLNLCASGLCIVMTRDVAQRPERTMAYFAASSALVLALSAAGSAIVLALGYGLGYAPDTQLALAVSCLALAPAAISVVLEAMFVAHEKAELVAYGTLVENGLRTVLSIAAIWLGFGMMSLFVILLATRLLGLGFYLVLFQRQVAALRWELDGEFFRRLLREWRVFAAENWLANIFWSLDAIVLSIFHSEAIVGLYAAAYKILNLGNALASSYVNAVFPYISRLFQQSKADFQRLNVISFRYMLAVGLPMAAALAALAERAVVLLYTEVYAEAVPILQVLSWVLLLRFVSPFLSHILFARGEQVRSLQVAVVGVALHLALAFWLIPAHGASGAALALLASAAVAFWSYFYFVFRGDGLLEPLFAIGRPLGVAVVLGGYVLFLKEAALVPLLGSLALLYLALLFAFGLLAARDLQLLMKLTSQALQAMRGTLRPAEPARGGG